MNKRHTIAALVRDQPGVLQRVVCLFGRKGCDIASLTIGKSEEEGLSRMTIVVRCDERIRDQLALQMLKLIDVVEAIPLAPGSYHSGELMLVRLRASAQNEKYPIKNQYYF